MEEIRRRYIVTLAAITCITCLISGIIIAGKNTRYMCFGEEFSTISISDIREKESLCYNWCRDILKFNILNLDKH